jgi:hypothetical protein
MNIGLRISAMHVDAVPPVRSIALIHLAEVRGLEAPVTIRYGAADDDGVRHAGMLSRHYDTDMISCWRGSPDASSSFSKGPDLFVLRFYDKGPGTVNKTPIAIDTNSGNSVAKTFRSRAFKYCRDFQLLSAVDEAPTLIHTNSGQTLTERPARAKARTNNKATRKIDEPEILAVSRSDG